MQGQLLLIERGELLGEGGQLVSLGGRASRIGCRVANQGGEEDKRRVQFRAGRRNSSEPRM